VGLRGFGSVSGFVFDDDDGDGLRNDDLPDIPGVSVQLYGEDGLFGSTYTDAEGK
jgi:hypothetical protein